MQYKSPIKTLSPFLQKNEKLEKIDLNQLKKRVFAEFELKRKSTLKTKYGEFSKNDILKVLENLEVLGNFKYHQLILEHKQLITLLEQNTVLVKTRFEEDYFDNKGFIDFISPYLTYSIGTYLASCLNKKAVYHPIYFSKNLPVNPKDEHLIIEPVTYALDTLISKVEAIQSRHLTKKMIKRVSKYFSPDLFLLVNSLPKRLFVNAVNLYAQSGIRLVFKFLQRGEKKYSSLNIIRNMINMLQNLNVTADIEERLKKGLKNYHLILNKSSTKITLWRIILFFLAFMFFLRIIAGIIEFLQ